MPESLTVAQAVLIISGYALAGIRLLTASKPIWGISAPARWATVILPAVLVGIGAVPPALEGAASWTDVVVALVTAAGAGFAASRGPAPKPPKVPPGSAVARDGTVIPPGPLTEEPRRGPNFPGAALLGLALIIGCSGAQSHPECTPAEHEKAKQAYVARVLVACVAYDVPEECPEAAKLKAEFERNVDRGCGQ